MGGVAGHMNHLYDNPDLTFRKMKEIIIAAGDGELEGTEKTDGQNIFITYDIQSHSARAARNKGNLKSGGLDAAGLAAKFAGRGSVEAAFNDAFSIFEQAVSSLSASEQRRVFQPLGPRYQVYYNSEIQDPRNANVINYDTKTLNIHRVGHVKYDKMTQEVSAIDLTKESKFIETVLSRMQRAVANQDFRIQMNAIRSLKSLDNKEPVKKALAALESVIDDAGVSDNNTVGEYLIARIVPIIQSTAQFDPEKEKMILKRILGIRDPETNKNYSIKQIKQDLPPREATLAIELVKRGDQISKDAIRPLEQVVHDYSVEVLRAFESMFVIDDDKEVRRLRAEVEHAIKSIEASGSDEAMEILQKHMTKLKSLDNVTTAAEGFVFDFEGVTYKFTGNFAPINQILGFFKYGRKGIPKIEPVNEHDDPMSTSPTSEPAGKVVGVFPGAFKPPHRGHLDVAAHLARFAQKVIVMISPLSRKSKDGMEFTADQSLKIWELYIASRGLSNVLPIVSSSTSPVRQAIDFVANEDNDPALAKPGDKVILGCSTKPDKRGNSDCTRFKDVDRYAQPGVEVVNPMKPEYSDFAFDPKPPALSASDFREILATAPQDMMPYLPEGVNPEDVLAILEPTNELSSLTESQKKRQTLSPDLLFSLVEEQLDLLLTEATQETADAYSEMSDTEKEIADVAKGSSEASQSLADAKEKAAKAAQDASKTLDKQKKALDLKKKGLEAMKSAEEEAKKAEELGAKALDAKKKAIDVASKAEEDIAKAAEAKQKAAELAAKAEEQAAKAAEAKQKAADVATKADDEMTKASEAKQKASEERAKALDAAKKASEEAAKLQDPAKKAEEEKQKSYEELQKAYEEAAKASEESSSAHEEHEKTVATTSDALGDAAKEEDEAEKEEVEKEKEQEERDKEQEEKDQEREEADQAAQERAEQEEAERETEKEADEAPKEAEEGAEEEAEPLEEVSAVATGGMEGAPGMKKKKKRDPETLIREDDDEIIEEIIRMMMGA